MRLRGYAGGAVKIDLSNRKIETFTFTEEVLGKYLGGRGLIDYFMYGLEAGINAFSEDNPLVIATGPVTGTLVPTSGRFAMGCKSPLTQTVSVGYSGGHWAPELKYAGFDALVITGRSETPVYILIRDQQIEIKDAIHLWGKDVQATEKLIREENQCHDLHVLGIGPAGENLVNFASVMVDCHHTVGRGGKGAVMGWKRLKAVAVYGTGGVKTSAPLAKVREKMYELFLEMRGNRTYSEWRRLGTAGILPVINEFGVLPTRNFETGYFDLLESISEKAITDRIVLSNACFNCNIACTGVMKIPGLKGDDIITEKPEYETFWSFGSMIDNSNLQGLLRLSHYCDLMGLDTMEAGHVLALTAELYSQGVISSVDLGDIQPKWGDTEGLLRLLRLTVQREGFGAILANGLKKAAELIGEEATSRAMHVKGFILAGYDPRGTTGMALNYATAARGADHNRGYAIAAEMLGTLQHKDRFDTENTPALISKLHETVAVVDSAVMCTFTRDLGLFDKYAGIIKLVTGIDVDSKSYQNLGRRIITLERLINLRENIGKDKDELPEYFSRTPMPSGPSKGHTVEIEPMRQKYYQLQGWDDNGIPTKECLADLGLELVSQ